jgi:hypothetical protein
VRVRLRWFDFTPSGMPLRRLAEAMQGRQYGRKRAAGFMLEEVRRDYITGRFIERVEWDDDVEDPVGGTVSVHRVELRQVQFRVASSSPELEVSDSSRALKSFVEHLSEAVGVDLRLVELSVPPDAWLAQLEAQSRKVVVVSIVAGGIAASNNVLASVGLAGTEDVRRLLKRFTDGRPFSIQRLVAVISEPAGKVELTRNGRALLSDGGSALVTLLRDSLRKAIDGR